MQGIITKGYRRAVYLIRRSRKDGDQIKIKYYVIVRTGLVDYVFVINYVRDKY